MPIANPFEIHPPICPVETCDCCDGAMLIADNPAFEDDPAPATLALPSEAMLHEAMDIVRKLHARDGEGSREELLIARLLDAYVLNAELLTRCVIHGRNGGETGDEEYDAEKLEEALDIAHDVVRAGLRTVDAPSSVPDSIRLDIGNWLTDAGLDRDSLEEREHDATATVVCDIEGCHVHAPTPTTFEA
jgi:hypothetical protein